MKHTTRRDFIGNSAKVSAAALFAFPALGSIMAANCNEEPATPGSLKTGYNQQPLPYAYNALEPAIDATTMELHYSKHAASYSKTLKEAATAEKIDMTKPLEDVLQKISTYSAKIRNNGGGHYNHELFWKCMRPVGEATPSKKLLASVDKNFGSMDVMKTQLSEAAKTRFGSGWAWVVVTNDNKLVVSSTPNQDNPLMDIAEVKGFPLFGIDVWEHAYYLKYQNRRAEYIENFWKVVNWDYINERFNSI